MFDMTNPQDFIGRRVYGTEGEKLGTIENVLLDDDSGRPEWLSVRTGLFGTHESFVPLSSAEEHEDGIRVPYDKSQIKDAPRFESTYHLTPEDEMELYRHYGISYDQPALGSQYGTTGRDTESTGYDTSGPTTDDAMTRSEERLRVGTERVETGRARLRKYIVTENVTQTVPVSHEEVRVEREPITERNVDRAMSGPEISEEEHEVVLHEERPVVAKETVPVERVRLTTDEVTEQEQVNESLRKEQIDLDNDEDEIDLRGTREDIERR